MKNCIKISSFIGWLLAVPLPMSAQHAVNTRLRNFNGVASTAINSGKMYEGSVGRNYIRFRKLLAQKDGEIGYDVKSKLEWEIITLTFKADTALVQTFEMRLKNDSLFVVHPTRTLPIGRYKLGDKIKMVRCKTGILFYKNGSLLEGYTLPNNNFVMTGEVRADKVLLSKGDVYFKPY